MPVMNYLHFQNFKLLWTYVDINGRTQTPTPIMQKFFFEKNKEIQMQEDIFFFLHGCEQLSQKYNEC